MSRKRAETEVKLADKGQGWTQSKLMVSTLFSGAMKQMIFLTCESSVAILCKAFHKNN